MSGATHFVSWVLFIGAVILAGLACWEKLANLWHMTLLRGFDPWRLLELAAVALLFVAVIQLREIRLSLGEKRPG
jgi:hypothetical protein